MGVWEFELAAMGPAGPAMGMREEEMLLFPGAAAGQPVGQCRRSLELLLTPQQISTGVGVCAVRMADPRLRRHPRAVHRDSLFLARCCCC